MNPVYYNPLGLYSDFRGQLEQHKTIQGLFNPAIRIFDRTETITCPIKLINKYTIPVGSSRSF